MSFEAAMEVLLEHERGFVNSPIDRGGPTNYGITQKTLARWRKVNSVSIDDVKNLTLKEATNIYRAWYWNEMRLDEVKSPLMQVLLLDEGVLNGNGTAVKKLQKALGFSSFDQDGRMGPKTLAALNAAKDTSRLGLLFLCEIQDRFVQLVVKDPTQMGNLAGWINRTQELILSCV